MKLRINNEKAALSQIAQAAVAVFSLVTAGAVFAADAKVEFKDYVQKIPGSTVSFEMVAIPGGEITIGSPENEAGREKTDAVQKKVTVKPFFMGKYEVKWEEYLLFVFGEQSDIEKEKADGVTRPTKPYGSVYRDRGEKGYPAIGMSQHSAEFFCKWISYKTGAKYRLPTEAEWEYACRAGATTPYFWGDDASKAGEYGWSKENSSGTTQPCGKKKANKFGVFDIVGNVAEWCAKDKADQPAVVRGGCFTEPAAKMRAASRMLDCPEWNELDPQSPPSIWWLSAADFVGIRLVRSAEEDATAKTEAKAEAKTELGAVAGDDKATANYKKLCAGCHGPDGKGQTKLGQRAGARDYTDAKVKATLKEEAMFNGIKEGVKVNDKEVMHPYKEKLTDEEIKGLAAYMKTFK